MKTRSRNKGSLKCGFMILFDFYFNLDFVDVTIKIFDLLI